MRTVEELTEELLRASYERTLATDNPTTDQLSTALFSASYPERPPWAIGPFRRDDRLTFTQQRVWPDPTGIGWRGGFVFNPSTIVQGGSLHLFYRASPKKESLDSRIGAAVFDRESGWTDSEQNPLIYPTLPNEAWGCEDPKVYRAEGRYFLFYNGIWPVVGTDELARYGQERFPLGDLGTDINVAVSDDLLAWEKLGRVVPHEVSGLWAKGAVIPRSPTGEAVKVGGSYVMYLSEGGAGQAIGRSDDLVHWEFESRPYLDIGELGGHLYEVACAATGHDGDNLVLDFYYRDASGKPAAGQALYKVADPCTQLALNRGGSLAWGGLTHDGDSWLFGQGWDAPEGSRQLYFYRSLPA